MRSDRVVVDTSLAIQWVLDEDDSSKAQALLADWIDRSVVVIAPTLIIFEVANVIHEHAWRRNELTPEEAAQAISDFHRIGIVFDQSSDLHHWTTLSTRAVEIARELNLRAVYDPQFLALAEQEDCEYWTADHRFFATVQRTYARMRWLGDYQPSPPRPDATN